MDRLRDMKRLAALSMEAPASCNVCHAAPHMWHGADPATKGLIVNTQLMPAAACLLYMSSLVRAQATKGSGPEHARASSVQHGRAQGTAPAGAGWSLLGADGCKSAAAPPGLGLGWGAARRARAYECHTLWQPAHYVLIFLIGMCVLQCECRGRQPSRAPLKAATSEGADERCAGRGDGSAHARGGAAAPVGSATSHLATKEHWTCLLLLSQRPYGLGTGHLRATLCFRFGLL
jgi:hypothetical protein